ncbi:MAG: hypothetical protein J6P50_08050, partial [Bacteroidales bacterium]|nr:hypothetical protein [Bacteroidales bacterium]
AVCPLRTQFVNTAEALLAAGERDKAVQIVDKCIEVLPQKNFPYNVQMLQSINEYSMLNLMEIYLRCDEVEKAKALAEAFVDESAQVTKYYGQGWPSESGMLSEDKVKNNLQYIYYVNSILKNYGEDEFADKLMEKVKAI